MQRCGAVIAWVGLGIALTAFFWPERWQGQGLIGGDTYTYLLPQKVFYAERLQAGEFPLWNPLVGHGYPLVAESQTGAFYPPNYLAYQLWEADTAYNLLQLFHYALAFVFSAALGRALGLSFSASALVGIVFVYGWFPARLSLEWAIVTGAWMPAALWCTEKLMTTGFWRHAAGLAVVLALQLLPGHFHLAFITQVLVLGYAAGRIWFQAPQTKAETVSQQTSLEGARRFALVAFSVVLGFGLAAMQWIPTWELKTLSQRSSEGMYYDPGYGYIPIWYFTQIVAPFAWYGDQGGFHALLPENGPSTNPVEAHLYFGLVPFALLIYGIFSGVYWRDRRWLWWSALGILGAAYATGELLFLTKPFPGFHFFRGVGRWGIVTTLTAALLSGAALHAWGSRARSRWLFLVMAGLVIMLTAVDLRMVRGLVGDAMFLENPPIEQRGESPIRKRLKEFPEPVRLFCRGPNLPTLLGVSSTPTYLGLSPEEYFDPRTAMPEPLPFDDPPTPKQVDWLQRAGVTHILSFSALEQYQSAWPVEFVWSGCDPFLSRAWARGPNEPLYLYRLKGSRGRSAWLSPESHQSPPEVKELSANRVVVETDSQQRGTVVLTALFYPGWEVTVDGQPREALRVEGMYRGVEVPAGDHTVTWRFRPASLFWGIGISGGTVLLLLLITGVRIFRNLKRE